MRHRILLTIVIIAAAALLFVPAASAMTFNQAVDKLVADGYPQSIETYLTEQGSSPIGFAFGGSSSDTARARYLATKMRALGFNVRLEAVPLDVMEFKGASVTVGSTTYTASTFGGVRGTPEGGINGELVYVGGGTAAEVTAAGDLSGKIAIVDALLGSYWMNWQWTEPALAGAAGIIYTGIAADDSYYAEPTALGSFDAEYRYALAPVVYISQADGTALKTALAGDPSLTATMVNDCPMTLARNGGKGYNVVATLPGTVKDAGRIVIGGHHDSYFRAGLDDTGGVVAGALMAKAMKLSRCRPAQHHLPLHHRRRVWRHGFLLRLAHWSLARHHPASPNLGRHHSPHAQSGVDGNGRRAHGNARHARGQGRHRRSRRGAPRACAQRLQRQGGQLLERSVDLHRRRRAQHVLRAHTAEYSSEWYHTDFDTIDLMDYDYLAQIAKLTGGIVKQFDRGLLPYDIAARAARPRRQRRRSLARSGRREPGQGRQAVHGHRRFVSRATPIRPEPALSRPRGGRQRTAPCSRLRSS